MALRVINDGSSDSNDLPWVNEFIELGGDVGTSSFVKNIKKGSNGYLILAEDFKGFLFAKSAIAKYIAEALELWVSNAASSYPLYAIADKGGKLSLAVDDDEALTVWIEETPNKSWEQKRKKGKGDGLRLPKSNPFLPTPPPTSNGRKRGSNEEHPDSPAMPH